MQAKLFVSAYGLLCAIFLFGCGQPGEIKRERFTGQKELAMYQAARNILTFLPSDFDYESMVLYRSEENGIVGLARKEVGGFMVGNSVNANLMTSCEFYEPVTILMDDISFSTISCGASGRLDGSKLTLSGVSDCRSCGMGASIDGTFTHFAEIFFDYSSGKAAVKQVYKLS